MKHTPKERSKERQQKAILSKRKSITETAKEKNQRKGFKGSSTYHERIEEAKESRVKAIQKRHFMKRRQ